MKRHYQVAYKRWMQTQKNFALVETVIECDHYEANQIGVMTFYADVEGLTVPVLSIPPGQWALVEMVTIEPGTEAVPQEGKKLVELA